MASTNSTVDGMGFEEMNQEQIQPSNIRIAGSIVAGKTGSFAGALQAADLTGNSVKAIGSYVDGSGVIYPVKAQVADDSVLAGYRVQAGSVTTANSNSGLIVFRDPYSTGDWFMTISPRNLTNPYKYAVTDFSGTVPMVSGLRRASGCWIIGGSKTEFDWIAVGTNNI